MRLYSDDLRALFQCWADLMGANKERLIELDSVVGDGDLGLTMSGGYCAAAKAAMEFSGSDLGLLLYTAGKAMASAVPSTMGTLMASGLMQAGKVMRGADQLPFPEAHRIFQAMFDGIQARGKARLGEKTVLDGFVGGIRVLREATGTPAATAVAAAQQAHLDFLATEGMLAKHGRAAIRGEQSRHLRDPGAAVAELLFQGFSDFISTRTDCESQP